MKRRPREVEPEGVPPLELRRFVVREWFDPAADPLPRPGCPYETPEQRWLFHAVKGRRRWLEARRVWASERGYDLKAPFGTKPDRDWWAFLRLCRGERSAR